MHGNNSNVIVKVWCHQHKGIKPWYRGQQGSKSAKEGGNGVQGIDEVSLN